LFSFADISLVAYLFHFFEVEGSRVSIFAPRLNLKEKNRAYFERARAKRDTVFARGNQRVTTVTGAPPRV
jgi:hypothetical protein